MVAIEASGTSTVMVPEAPSVPVGLSAWTSQVTLMLVPPKVSLKMRRFVVRVAPFAIAGTEAGQSPLALDIVADAQ